MRAWNIKFVTAVDEQHWVDNKDQSARKDKERFNGNVNIERSLHFRQLCYLLIPTYLPTYLPINTYVRTYTPYVYVKPGAGIERGLNSYTLRILVSFSLCFFSVAGWYSSFGEYSMCMMLLIGQRWSLCYSRHMHCRMACYSQHMHCRMATTGRVPQHRQSKTLALKYYCSTRTVAVDCCCCCCCCSRLTALLLLLQ